MGGDNDGNVDTTSSGEREPCDQRVWLKAKIVLSRVDQPRPVGPAALPHASAGSNAPRSESSRFIMLPFTVYKS